MSSISQVVAVTGVSEIGGWPAGSTSLQAVANTIQQVAKIPVTTKENFGARVSIGIDPREGAFGFWAQRRKACTADPPIMLRL